MRILRNLLGSYDGPPPFTRVRVDIHSHLIPGIDDGAADMAESLQLIQELQSLGFKKLITTPHVMSDAYRNTPAIILGGLGKLRQALKNEGIEIEIEAAAEYYLDEWFIKNLDHSELLSFGGEKRYLLFETSYTDRPLSLQHTIFRLKTMGYSPVMAHPERYHYFWKHEDVSPIQTLRERGALMQVNLSSFAGTGGRRAARISREMAKKGLIDFIGTDLHRLAQIASVRKAFKVSRELRQLSTQGTLLNHIL